MNRAMQENGQGRIGRMDGGFAGHLRVRRADPGEMRAFAVLFEDAERRRWAAETLAAGRALALVVERSAGRAWVAAGRIVTDAEGETAVAVDPGERGRGLAHEVLRAGIRVLREEPFTALTARIGPGEVRAAKAFEKAGFAPAGSCRFGDRPSMRYIRNLRGDCTPYNVWI